MKTKGEDRATGQHYPMPPASAKRRFSIEKLEERIAPKRGGKGTNNCGGDSSGSGSSWSGDTVY